MSGAYVQQAYNSTGQGDSVNTAISTAGGGTQPTPFPVNNTPGNFILYLAFYDSSGSVITFTPVFQINDDQGNSYTKIGSVTDATGYFYAEFGYAKNIIGGSKANVTANLISGLGGGGGPFKGVAALEFSGLDTATPFTTGENAQQQTTGTSLVSGLTPTLAENNGFAIGWSSSVHNLAGAPTVGTGWNAAGSPFWDFGFSGSTFCQLSYMQLANNSPIESSFTGTQENFTGVAVFRLPSGFNGIAARINSNGTFQAVQFIEISGTKANVNSTGSMFANSFIELASIPGGAITRISSSNNVTSLQFVESVSIG